ncbi:hypothetical protein [Phenylobacterium sp.]|uniref:hypothetical protein n=1 Tax=Phenylobacterium sp. TaxID=1871053 RepID=UPI002BD800B3|nr:hypothetical protein [Phenylobacterium sp.]HLZ73443.1 hypothetical protein [Phenylobacterium sp.]
MHVLISVTAAFLMQTPGVHISALDAAVAVEKAAVSQGRGASAAGPLARGPACPCLIRRHAS